MINILFTINLFIPDIIITIIFYIFHIYSKIINCVKLNFFQKCQILKFLFSLLVVKNLFLLEQ